MKTHLDHERTRKTAQPYPLAKAYLSLVLVPLIALAVGLILPVPRMDPKLLLAIVSDDSGSTNHPDSHLSKLSIDDRIEALRTLLAMQLNRFGAKIPEARPQNTGGIDHRFLRVEEVSNERIKLLATLSSRADYQQPEGGYWNIEQFTFDRSGKLLDREPYQERP